MNKFLKKSVIPYCLVQSIVSGCSHSQIATEPYPIWGESNYLSAEDGESQRHLQVIQASTDHTLEACLLIVHGMNEHSGRYGDIAKYFADRYLVAAIDLTGHGLSNPVLLAAHNSIVSRGTEYDASAAYLEQAQLRNLNAMRKDVHQALKYLIKRCDHLSDNRSLPLFILSHSLGSLVSASYLLEIQDETILSRIKGIIFTGPAFAGTEVPGWRGWFQNPLIRFTFHTQEHFLDPHREALPLMAFNQLLALATVPLQNGLIELLSLPGIRNLVAPGSPDWVAGYLSDWEEEQIRYQNDKYILHRCILRYVQGVQKEIIQFRKNMAGFETPYLLIYSEHDPITAAWGNTDFAAITLDKHPDNEIMELAGKSHHEQLFSEPVLRREILQRIDQWLKRRMDNQG